MIARTSTITLWLFAAQFVSDTGFTSGLASGSAPPARRAASDFELTSIHLPDAAAPDELEVVVEAGGDEYALLLRRHSLRSSRFELRVGGQRVDAPPVRTYRGDVVTKSGLAVAGAVTATLTPRGIEAEVRLPGRRPWSLSPYSAAAGVAAPRGLHVWRHTAEDDEPSDADRPDFPRVVTMSAPATTGNRILELAIDTDVEYFQLNNGSVEDTLADIELVMNGVSGIYEKEVGLTFVITTVVLRTIEPDPYSFTAAAALMNQFKLMWSNNMGDVHRDLAHLFTGKLLSNGVHGYALSGSTCSKLIGYALSETQFNANLTKRVALTAHQLGHNLGAVDCSGSGNGCQIMCETVGDCGGMTGFGQAAKTTIKSVVAGSLCLHDEPQPLALPLEDDFPVATLSTDNWITVIGATVDAGAVSPPSGSLALHLAADGPGAYQDHEARTNRIDISAADAVRVRFATEHRGVESGERLVVEYTEGGVSWTELLVIESNGANQSSFVQQEVMVPAAVKSKDFQLRFRAEVDETNDHWYVDDLSVVDVDLAPPTLTQLVVPAAWLVGADLTVSVKASDDKSGVASVVARVVDGPTVLGQATLKLKQGTKYEAKLPAALAGAGERDVSIEIEATDFQGNAAQLAADTAVFDLPTFPDVVITPVDPTDTDDVLVSAVVFDSSNLATVEATFKLNSQSPIVVPMALQGNDRHEATFPSQDKSGSLVITLKATDEHGNEAIPWKQTIDVWPSVSAPPEIVSVTPSPDPLEVGQALAIVAKVKDADSPAPLVTARLLQGATQFDEAALTNVPGTTLFDGALVQTGTLVEGPYQIEVTAVDLQGNVSQESFSFEAFKAPVVSNLAVSPSSFDSTEAFTVSAQLSHDLGVASATALFSVDGGQVEEAPMTFNSGNGRFEVTFDPTGEAGAMVYGVYGMSTNGHESSTLTQGVFVNPSPVVLSLIVPDSGSVGGGTAIEVLGAGFLKDADIGVPRVLIGGNEATDVVVHSDQSITALSPPGAGVGFVDVVVQVDKAGLVIQDSMPNAFKYGVPPVITQITPNSGSAYGETQIAVLGTGLAADGDPADISVKVGTRAAISVEIVNDQALFAIIPGGGDPKQVDEVCVSTPYGSSFLPLAFNNQGVALREVGTRLLASANGVPTAAAYFGDMNGDGVADVAIGAPNAGGGSGRVLILSGADLSTLLTLSPITGGAVDFGAHVMAVDDRDGDGRPEIVVSDPAAGSGAGRVQLIRSSDVAVQWTVDGPSSGAGLGYAVVDLGDLNGDGLSELAAGVPGVASGEVWLLDGQSGAQFDALTGDLSNERFGEALAARRPDSGKDHLLAVGAPSAAPFGLTDAGRVYLFRIQSGSLNVSSPFVVDGIEAGAAKGPAGTSLSVALLGGNKPGAEDERVAIGFPGADAAGVDSGVVRLIREGSGDELWSTPGAAPGVAFGAHIAAAGRLDGDDLAELLVAAPGEGALDTASGGTVFVLAGDSGVRAAGIYGDRDGLRLGLGGVIFFEDSDHDAMPEIFALSDASSGADEVWHYALHPASSTKGAAPGAKASGKLTSGVERDGLRFDLVDGEVVSFKFSPNKKTKTPFQLNLFDGDGALLLTSDSEHPDADAALAAKEGKALQFEHVADSDQTIHLVISNRDATKKSSYKLTSKRTSDASVDLEPAVIPYTDALQPLEYSFYATAGSRLGGKVVAAGSKVEVVDLVFDEVGLSVLSPKAVKSKKDAAIIKAKKQTLPITGWYHLRMLPGPGAGSLEVQLKLTLPKDK